MNDWMSVEDTAKYLQMGKTALYSLAREGRIPASKVGTKWLFKKDALDNWILASNKSTKAFFIETEAHIDENPLLREPQIEAYNALYNYFRTGKKKAILQIPVGCGKSGIAALAPFGIAHGRVLVITPNLTIKTGLFESFDITNRQKCFWRKRKVLDEKDMLGGPLACTLDTGNVSVCEKSHIVISNVQQLATNPEKWLTKFAIDFFDLIVIDEAHHSAASSWRKVVEHFRDAKILNMTATPFRSDNQEIDGELIYRYPFKKATFNGYIKNIKAWYAVPTQLIFTARGQTKTYSLEEVLKMKEQDWFSRGIALSDVCNQTIVNNSLEKLEEARKTGTHHQLIGVACSVDHAKSIRSMYSARGFSADVIHSDMDEDKKEDVMRRLKSGELDCIIQVQMLGEGFDHPKLTVAAIFRPFRTLAPYIQFVGRVLRVIVENDPRHPDNYGHVVTHAGMNLDKRLHEFKLFESDDQKFWEEIINGADPQPPREVSSGAARMRIGERAIANHEIVETLIEEDFTSADDEDLIRELEQRLEMLGLDPGDAKIIVAKQKGKKKFSDAAEPYQILPQRQWEESKRRLNEQVTRSANLLLNRLDLQSKRAGRDLVNKGIPATNNFTACLVAINQEIKKRHPKERGEWSEADFQTVIGELDDVLNKLTRQYKKVLSDE